MTYEELIAGTGWTNLPPPQFGGGLLDAPTNRYQQIMSQMAGTDNYVVPTTTGGYIPSIYDVSPAQNQAVQKFNNLVSSRIIGGGGTASANAAAQKAAMDAAIAQMTPGEVAEMNAMTIPNLVNLVLPFPIKVVLDALGMTPGTTSSGGIGKTGSPMMGIASKGTVGQVANAVTTANNAAAAGGKGSGPGGATGNVGIGMGATTSGLGTGIGASVGGIGGGLYMGGKVTKDKMMQPDPNGPDDGYVALQDGEYVIKKKSVDKYGHGLLQALNSGNISKKKTKGLLEA
jgi:hypothetical protein